MCNRRIADRRRIDRPAGQGHISIRRHPREVRNVLHRVPFAERRSRSAASLTKTPVSTQHVPALDFGSHSHTSPTATPLAPCTVAATDVERRVVSANQIILDRPGTAPCLTRRDLQVCPHRPPCRAARMLREACLEVGRHAYVENRSSSISGDVDIPLRHAENLLPFPPRILFEQVFHLKADLAASEPNLSQAPDAPDNRYPPPLTVSMPRRPNGFSISGAGSAYTARSWWRGAGRRARGGHKTGSPRSRIASSPTSRAGTGATSSNGSARMCSGCEPQAGAPCTTTDAPWCCVARAPRRT